MSHCNLGSRTYIAYPAHWGDTLIGLCTNNIFVTRITLWDFSLKAHQDSTTQTEYKVNNNVLGLGSESVVVQLWPPTHPLDIETQKKEFNNVFVPYLCNGKKQKK